MEKRSRQAPARVPHVVRMLLDLALAGADISGHPDAAAVAYAQREAERIGRARDVKTLESGPPVVWEGHHPSWPKRITKHPRPRAGRPWVEPYVLKRAVRHKDGTTRRSEVQRGDEATLWDVEGNKETSRRTATMTFPNGSQRELCVDVLGVPLGPSAPQQPKAKRRGRRAKFGRAMTEAERKRWQRHGTVPGATSTQQEQT
jgi:hypothetical protein